MLNEVFVMKSFSDTELVNPSPAKKARYSHVTISPDEMNSGFNLESQNLRQTFIEDEAGNEMVYPDQIPPATQIPYFVSTNNSFFSCQHTNVYQQKSVKLLNPLPITNSITNRSYLSSKKKITNTIKIIDIFNLMYPWPK